MAQLNSSPWLLTPLDVGSLFREKPAFVSSFVFSDYADPADRCEVRDLRGNIIFSEHGDQHNAPIVIEPGCTIIMGMQLTQLDSGTLKIYIE